MRLSGRIAAAIEILDSLQQRRRPVALALRDWGQANRFAGSGDRAAIGNLVYDALRRRASHGWAMQADTGRALVLSVAVRDWGEDPQALQGAFERDNFAPDPVSPEEMTLLQADMPLQNAPDHVRADLPEWLVPAFKETFGTNWLEQARALTMRPPLDLRVNSLKATPEKVVASLQRFRPQPAPVVPLGLRIPAGGGPARVPNAQADEALRKGRAEIQDAGSQIAAALCGAEAGQQVLDYCAGGGGKTLALAAAMHNKGQIFAHDADRNRLAPIYDRLKRNGIRNVQVRAPVPGSLDALAGAMDRVVVDAPCSGAGTWRRHPDAKWRLTPEQLKKRMSEQAAILREAARFVAPGGQLVYITCSLLPEENQHQIARFLAEMPAFSPIDPQKRWQETFPDSQEEPLFVENGLVLSPLSTATDGFFISVLQETG